MGFREYQEKAITTAIYGGKGEYAGLAYTTLGLVGEAGEIANKVKKIFRDQEGVITVDNVKDLGAEIGDCLWYLANMAEELGILLENCADVNIEKLFSRKERGVLQGSGDNR